MGDYGYIEKRLQQHFLYVLKSNYSVDDYMDLMRKLYMDSSALLPYIKEKFREYQRVFLSDNYTKKLNSKACKEIVKEFLKSVDIDLYEEYKNALKSGSIEFHTDKQIRKMEKNSDNYYCFENLTGTHNNKVVSNIILTNTIEDPFLIVHEFTHYLSIKKPGIKSIDWLHLTEAYAYFMERKLSEMLLDSKWKSDTLKMLKQELYVYFLRTFEFRNQFVYLDIAYHFDHFTPQKVYKYFKDDEDARKYTKLILENSKSSATYLRSSDNLLTSYLEDSRYVFALMSQGFLEKDFETDKDAFLLDILNLEDKSLDEFYDKNDSNDNLTLTKVVRRGFYE